MSEQINDEKFKSDVMRFIEVATQKFDGLATDVRTNSFKLDKLETGSQGHNRRFDILDENFAVLREQVRIVDGKVSDMLPRLLRSTSV